MKWPALLALVVSVPAAKANSPVYTSLVFGNCTAQSFAGYSGREEDVTQRKQHFHCDRVTVDFLDRRYKRMRLTFPGSGGSVSSLAFTGIREQGQQVVNVSTFAYDGGAPLQAMNSSCKLSFAGKNIKGVLCRADSSSGSKDSVLVAFEASSDQSLGDDDDQP